MLEHGDFWVDAWQPEASPAVHPPVAPAGISIEKARTVPILGPSACRGRPANEKLPQPVVDGDFWSIADTYLCMEQYMMAAKAELFGDGRSGTRF